MRTDDILNEMHKLSHDDEQRYRLLMRYLRLVDQDRKHRGFLDKFRSQWRFYNKHKHLH